MPKFQQGKCATCNGPIEWVDEGRDPYWRHTQGTHAHPAKPRS